jgi:hypothetical protein
MWQSSRSRALVESHFVPGQLQISAATRAALGERSKCERRCLIEVQEGAITSRNALAAKRVLCDFCLWHNSDLPQCLRFSRNRAESRLVTMPAVGPFLEAKTDVVMISPEAWR